MPADPHDIPALIAALGEAAVGSRELDDREACGDNCTQWERDANAGLPVYPGRRTQKEWVPIAAASYARTGNLPDD